MKKWGFILLIALCLLIWKSVQLYEDAVEPKRLAESRALQRVEKAVDFAEINDIYTYYGDQQYVTVVGTDEDQNNIIAWVPEKQDRIIVKEQNEGISQEKAVAKLTAERDPKEIVSVRLGMEKGLPLWEITYIDQENRYSFYYLSFEDGTFIRRYSFHQ